MVNPYTEILARALYRNESSIAGIPVKDREAAKDAIKFMNSQTYHARFQLNIVGDGVEIKYLCECCHEDLPQREKAQLPEPTNHLQALVQIVGQSIHQSVCDKKECQDYAQYQCDEFDRCRKGE